MVMVSYIIAGAFFFGLLTDVAIDEKVKTLEKNVPQISELSSIALSSKSTQIMSIYRTVVDSIAANTDSAIIIFDKNGVIVTVSELKRTEFVGATINNKITDDILSGKRYFDKGLMDKYFNESTLTFGAPLVDKGGVFGGVLFNMPVPRIRTMNFRIFKSFASMSLIALCFSFVLYYVISRRITNPIKKMNIAVTEFARGDFSKRIECKHNNELDELASNFNYMATALENLENMRSSFVADVSHELRTPLTTISGFLEGILDGTVKKGDQEKYLQIALDETKRISRLVNDLLSVSRIENNQLILNKQKFDLNELVAQELFKFETVINEKNINVELNLTEDAPFVLADKDAIIQVVTNLIHNAVKFTYENGEIWIKTWTDGGKAYVEIKNSGKGIESEKLKFIFDRFYKTDDSRSKDKNGVGLGLFIVKNLIAKHGERIWAESEVDKYTRFVFSLPLS